jgi:hypothetical protein
VGVMVKEGSLIMVEHQGIDSKWARSGSPIVPNLYMKVVIW